MSEAPVPEMFMLDLFFLGGGVLLFALLALYARSLDRL